MKRLSPLYLLFILPTVFLLSCSITKDTLGGIYIQRGANKTCGQLSVFADLTYEYVMCGELQIGFKGRLRIDGDTLFFYGDKLPSQHNKYLFQKNHLYKIHYNSEVSEHWTFKHKNRRAKEYSGRM